MEGGGSKIWSTVPIINFPTRSMHRGLKKVGTSSLYSWYFFGRLPLSHDWHLDLHYSADVCPRLHIPTSWACLAGSRHLVGAVSDNYHLLTLGAGAAVHLTRALITDPPPISSLLYPPPPPSDWRLDTGKESPMSNDLIAVRTVSDDIRHNAWAISKRYQTVIIAPSTVQCCVM